jgi:hypothetical protein
LRWWSRIYGSTCRLFHVRSATENQANSILAAFSTTVPLQAVNLPSIVVGGNTVSLQGTIALLSPQVAFHDRTDNLVTTSLAVGGLLVLNTSSQPQQFVDAVLSVSIDVALTTSVQNNNVVSSIDLSQIVINSLGIQYLSAPPSPLYQNAVASPAVIAAINAIINLLPAFPLTVNLMSATLNQPISRGKPPGMDPPYNNRSIFPPYPDRCTVTASVSNIVTRQLEGALTVAGDLAASRQEIQLNSLISPVPSCPLQRSLDRHADHDAYGRTSSGQRVLGPPDRKHQCVPARLVPIRSHAAQFLLPTGTN